MSQRKARQKDVELMRKTFLRRAGAELQHRRDRWPDCYRVRITKINDDGSFTGQLLEVWPCL